MHPVIRFVRFLQRRQNTHRIADNPNNYHVDMQSDIAYMPGSSFFHLLDVYRPIDKAGILPVIVELHGGSYISCFKEINRQHGQYLASKGFAVVNINYTLCLEGGLSEMLNDLSATLQWVRMNAERFGFDVKHVFLTADSAGAHVAMLGAAIFTTGRLADYFNVIKPGIPIMAAGVSCPQASFDPRLLPKRLDVRLLTFILRKYTHDLEYTRNASYESFIDDSFPPLWIGTTPDDDLLYKHAKRLHQFLNEHGLHHCYCEYNAQTGQLGHVFNVLDPDRPESRQANDDMIRFFKSLLPE